MQNEELERLVQSIPRLTRRFTVELVVFRRYQRMYNKHKQTLSEWWNLCE